MKSSLSRAYAALWPVSMSQFSATLAMIAVARTTSDQRHFAVIWAFLLFFTNRLIHSRRQDDVLSLRNFAFASCMLSRQDLQIGLTSDSDVWLWTGWTKASLLEWRQRIFGVDTVRAGRQRHSFDLDTLIVASMFRMRSGVDYKIISKIFGRDGRQWGDGVNAFVDELSNRYAKKLMQKKSLRRYQSRMDDFRKAIIHRLAKPNCDGVPPFQCEIGEDTVVLFVDCIILLSTRPGATSIGGSTSSMANLFQQAVYTGYLKAHGYKYQILTLPNGMCGGLFGGSARNSTRSSLARVIFLRR